MKEEIDGVGEVMGNKFPQKFPHLLHPEIDGYGGVKSCYVSCVDHRCARVDVYPILDPLEHLVGALADCGSTADEGMKNPVQEDGCVVGR